MTRAAILAQADLLAGRSGFGTGESSRSSASLLLWRRTEDVYEIRITHDDVLVFIRGGRVLLTSPADLLESLSVLPGRTVIALFHRRMKLIMGQLG